MIDAHKSALLQDAAHLPSSTGHMKAVALGGGVAAIAGTLEPAAALADKVLPVPGGKHAPHSTARQRCARPGG